MSRPIYEPSLQRTDARLGYGTNQLFRRPAPTMDAGGTSSIYFDSFDWTGTGNSIPNDTWTAVVTGVNGTNTRWFDEVNFDPDGGWGYNFDNGWIKHAGVAYNFTAWGYVSFDVPNNTIIGAQINWFGEEVQINTGTTQDGVKRIEVQAERTPIPTGGVRLWCYQKSGGAADLLEARLHVRRFELYQDVYEQDFAT